MNDQQTINSGENDTVKSNRESFEKIIHISIAILTLLFTARFFILSNINVQGCDGLFGGLSGNCGRTTYSFWGFFSMLLTSLSLAGAVSKNFIPSIIGSLLFLVCNIFLLSDTTVDLSRKIEIECITFSGVLFFIEILCILSRKTHNA